jgi:hypothetical protein
MVNAADRIGFTCIADKNGGVLPEKVPTDAVLKECTESPTYAVFFLRRYSHWSARRRHQILESWRVGEGD